MELGMILGGRPWNSETKLRLLQSPMRVRIRSNRYKGGPLAQLAEQLTFNQGVAGSRPARPT